MNFKKISFSVLILILMPLSAATAQGEAANWYFGANAGLDFNSGEPIPLLDGALNAIEGCSAISSPEGGLLFYTDGVSVWNRNHEIMPNGEVLVSVDTFSSTQGAIVVPKPGSNNIYYIFTTDVVQAYQGGDGDGFNYSTIDMNAGGGLGDVIGNSVNLIPNSTEKVTAVRTADGEDFWVITYSGTQFYAYKVTSAGVNETPVISDLGPVIADFNNIRGGMKVSPRGDKIAVAHTVFEPRFDGLLYLYDFNNATGVVSNEVLLGDDLVYYGVEFSANSKVLYASGKQVDVSTNSTEDIDVLQFDLTAPDIAATRFRVANFANILLSDLAGTLQIAYNKKIYHAIPGTSLSVINAPNNLGLDNDFRKFEQSLGGRQSIFGLPPFVQSFFESIIDIENFCFGEETTFSLDTEDDVTAINWNFGDPASGTNNTSTLLNPTHVFSAPGVYTVRLEVEFANRADQVFEEIVEINPAPQLNNNVTLVQCDVDEEDGFTQFNLREAIPELLDNPIGFTATFFETLTDAQNNENNLVDIPYENTSNPQTIYVRVFANASCFTIAPLVLEVEPMSKADDLTVSVCGEGSLDGVVTVQLTDLEGILLDFYPGTEITFYETEEDALLELNMLIDIYQNEFGQSPQLYYRIEDDNDCAFIGLLILDVRPSPNILDQFIVSCPDDEFISLDAGPGFLTYLWSTGETTQTIFVDDPGIYTVTVSNGEDCFGTGTYTVENILPPGMVDVEVVDFTNNNSITITATDCVGCQFSLNGGVSLQDENVFDGLRPGVYTVQIWKDGCLVYENVVIVGGPPEFFTPNNDGYNDTWSVLGIEDLNDAIIYIMDRYGKLLKQMNPNSEGWDGTYRGEALPSSDYWYRIELADGRMVSGNFTLKR